MRRRKTRARKSDGSRYAVAVTASSVRVNCIGPDILALSPGGVSETTIHIEGKLDRPVIRMMTASIVVFCDGRDDGNPGSAIGGNQVWQIVVRLPRAQFMDLLMLVLAEKLVKADMFVGPVRYGKGTVRSISFETRPVPGEAEEDEETDDAGG